MKPLLCAMSLVAAACGGGAPAAPVELSRWLEPATGMVFVQVPAGRFVMGSPPEEPGREPQERQHEVRLSRPFWLGATEVTQRQWQLVMGSNPSHFQDQGDQLPVESVTWFEVQGFLERLAKLSPGSRFRLPTEAEWEYACRAGTTSAYSTGATLSPAQARFEGLSKGTATGPARPLPAGSFPPNAWGFYDLHGNVWEWTRDEHCPYPSEPATDPAGSCGSTLRVIRGGSWHYGADSARCALRYTHRPQDRGFSLGFRVVREGG
ncbi:MAG TPA: formylglycine-generating enzyme family protein [Thermoanaerobaculia bacterium]|nr:formylglycine-generating enzyme family protein [Thermoanaerobaculia bacterium]